MITFEALKMILACYDLIFAGMIIAPAVKYPKHVILAKAGAQKKHWMPDHLCHDGVDYLLVWLISKQLLQ